MADADKATDLVISYVAHQNEIKLYAPLHKALDEGYRVVDVVTTSMAAGGGSSGIAPVVVTVILSLPGHPSAYQPKSHR